MWRRFYSDRLPGGLLIIYACANQLWQLPSHIGNAQWWLDRLAMLESDYTTWAVLVIGTVLLFRPELGWLGKKITQPKQVTSDLSDNVPIREAIDHIARTSPHSFSSSGRAELHFFGKLHEAMCDGTISVIGSRGEGSPPKRISARECKRLKPTTVVIPASRSAPQGVRFDLIDKPDIPKPLVETDKPMGFTGLRVRSDDLYRLWPKNQEITTAQDISYLQRCLDELIEYSGQEFPRTISSIQIGASNALLVHLKRACNVLDKQGIPHPEIGKGIVLGNVREWIEFLSDHLARDDAG